MSLQALRTAAAPNPDGWFCHAKSGEVCEHVNTLQLVAANGVAEPAPTYRGEGRVFV
jgi:hypothetical protein